MTKKASVKETGEETSEAKWDRFERAVGVGQDRRKDDTQTDQPFRDEIEDPKSAGGDAPRPDDAGDPERQRLASKTTKRTE